MQRTVRAAVTLVAVLAVGVAGCVGDAPSEPQPPASDGPTAGNGSAPRTPSPAASGRPLTFPGAPVQTVLWRNGSFGPHEACVPAGCVADTEDQALDLSEVVPVGTPTRVVATLSWEGQGLDGVFLELETSDATVYRSTRDRGAQRSHLEALLVRRDGGTVRLVVSYGFPQVTTDGTMDYRLRADLMSEPRAVPTGIPVKVPVGDSADRLGVRPLNGSGVRAWLWGPDDTLAARLDLAAAPYWVDLPDAAGDHVLYVHEADGPVAVATDGEPAGSMEALEVRRVQGPARKIPADGSAVSWSFELDRTPLGVGVYVANGTSGTYTISGPQARIASPQGDVFALSSTGTFSGTGSRAWWAIGDSDLVTGTYDATFQGRAGVDARVGHLVVEYVR